MASVVNNVIEQVKIGTGTANAIAPSVYGECATAAATAAKTVEMTGFTLIKGVSIFVKFTYSNTVANPTLNVNGTGAIAIKRYGTTAVGKNGNESWNAGEVVGLTYDGTNWLIINHALHGNDNTYTSAYCSTAAGTAAKTASCTGYVLLDKSYLHIIITNSNTSAGALTLNVNSKGAKAIYINGEPSSSTNYTLPAGSYLTYYENSIFYFRTDGKLPNPNGTSSDIDCGTY